MYFSRHINIQNSPFLKIRYSYFFVFFCLLFTSCSSEVSVQNSTKQLVEVESGTTPAHTLSPELNIIFKESCAQCHLNNSSGAPLSGDSPTWKKILAKGIEATLDRAMNGYGGMPPAGQCFECTPEQLIELIHYMSAES